MVFSSIPAYNLDPANWQQLNHQVGTSIPTTQLASAPPQPAPPPPLPPPPHGSVGTIRPGSMADRARLANIPMPETALKCPRCESTNTKFCYFNNYSLSQPRHFCKTCRRYWTRGGALRNVPVGGGCRRNKRSSKGSSSSGNTSKSPTTSSERQSSSSSSAVSTSSIISGNSAAALLGGGLSPQIPPLRFMSPLGQLSEHYTSGNDNIGLNINYTGLSAMAARDNFPFQFVNNNNNSNNINNNNNLLGIAGGGGGGGSGGGGGGLASLLAGSIEQWRLQTPTFGGLDLSPPGLYQFPGGPEAAPSGFLGGETSEIRPKFTSSSMLTTQLASVKMEDHNNQESSMARQLLGFQPGNEQWGSGAGAGAAAWSDVSASFSSSSTSNNNPL